MSAAVQLTEMQLIKKLTYNYVRQTHGSKRAALTAASDIISPLVNCATPSDCRAAADRRSCLSTAAL